MNSRPFVRHCQNKTQANEKKQVKYKKKEVCNYILHLKFSTNLYIWGLCICMVYMCFFFYVSSMLLRKWVILGLYVPVYVKVWGVCGGGHVCIWVCVCMCMCGGQKSTSDIIFLQELSVFPLETVSHWDLCLQLECYGWPVSPRNHCVSTSQCWGYKPTTTPWSSLCVLGSTWCLHGGYLTNWAVSPDITAIMGR